METVVRESHNLTTLFSTTDDDSAVARARRLREAELVSLSLGSLVSLTQSLVSHIPRLQR